MSSIVVSATGSLGDVLPFLGVASGALPANPRRLYRMRRKRSAMDGVFVMGTNVEAR
jgi:hypothetical protein